LCIFQLPAINGRREFIVFILHASVERVQSLGMEKPASGVAALAGGWLN
jgi:hypothetical protein